MKKNEIIELKHEIFLGVDNKLGYEENIMWGYYAKIFQEGSLKESAAYILHLMRESPKIEADLLEKKKKVNSWYKRNEGYYEYLTPIKLPLKGCFTHIYRQDEEFVFAERPMPKTLFYYLLESKLIEPIGQVMYQEVPHEAWKPK